MAIIQILPPAPPNLYELLSVLPYPFAVIVPFITTLPPASILITPPPRELFPPDPNVAGAVAEP